MRIVTTGHSNATTHAVFFVGNSEKLDKLQRSKTLDGFLKHPDVFLGFDNLPLFFRLSLQAAKVKSHPSIACPLQEESNFSAIYAESAPSKFGPHKLLTTSVKVRDHVAELLDMFSKVWPLSQLIELLETAI
ncbi:hypothetical protein KC363_g202 [Hortaea werneckii]|nr:hypothetical protein KC363_g202 [Hortaea werneckii]